MTDKITVELSEEDVERLSSRIIEKNQAMIESGKVPTYWVPKLLKLKRVAEILGKPRSTVRDQIKRIRQVFSRKGLECY